MHQLDRHKCDICTTVNCGRGCLPADLPEGCTIAFRFETSRCGSAAFPGWAEWAAWVVRPVL
eukprot:scaffold33039_cov42-Prasinocladus_malaysianus.AAC.1